MTATQNFERLATNKLLAALPADQLQRLLPHLKPVPLTLKQILHEPDQPIPFVYFPTNGVVSLLTVMQNGAAPEATMIGREGMVGLPVFLGVDRASVQAVVQLPGQALRMEAKVFKRRVTPSSRLHTLLQRYTQASLNQSNQIAACNRLHSIYQRCCCWLLMSRDRMESDQLYLTQALLAKILGVRRTGISEIASEMQKRGLIQSQRGTITILDHSGLEASACECYATLRAQNDRLLSDVD